MEALSLIWIYVLKQFRKKIYINGRLRDTLIRKWHLMYKAVIVIILLLATRANIYDTKRFPIRVNIEGNK